MTTISHRIVRESIRQRIKAGEWGLGELIPAEAALAQEYGCARTTINRAVQTLAKEGLVVRKRKGGTRICQMPSRLAKFEIAIVREQVQANGSHYQHKIIQNKQQVPPLAIRKRLRIAEGHKAIYIETLHLADEQPFAFEQRWLNLQTVPEILQAPLSEISVNEWLVKTIPFSSGNVSFSATSASEQVSQALKSKEGEATFVVDRTTWIGEEFITTMTLFYKSGYQIHSQL